MAAHISQVLTKEGIFFKEEEPMAAYTSFRIGGPCRFLVFPKTAREVCAAVDAARQAGMPWQVLGNGSNVLVRDEGYDGMILLSSRMDGISVSPYGNASEGENGGLLECGAGVPLAKLCSTALSRRLAGLEFAWGIPGSVGGAVYMNAGAYGGEIRDVLESASFLDERGEVRTFSNQELDFSYRHSWFEGKSCFILSASFALKEGDPAAIRARMEDYMIRRREKQPLEYPSAGSTFKRPKGGYAAALIEQCGLKGYQVGGAQVSEKHSGFLINLGGATCRDMLTLIEQVQKTVLEKTGCALECEVRIL